MMTAASYDEAVMDRPKDARAARLAAQDGQELELKLDLDPVNVDRLVASAIFADAPAQEQCSTYFDTADDTLRRAGLSLRVRRTGDRYVQTVKAADGAAAGIFARSEWERDVVDGTPVIDQLGTPLDVLLDSASRLAPAFEVDVTRRTALIERPGASIEVVLDRGRIQADQQMAPVCEIELELKEGEPEALFAMAREIGAIVPLRLGVLAKSERGYELRQRDPDRPVKSSPISLDRRMTAAEGFQAIAYACLRQFRQNEAILIRTGSAGSLHQTRVALRRLRSALSIFKPMLADDRFDHIRSELRWIAGELGDARNLDVLIERLADEETAVPLGVAREQAYEAAYHALASARLRSLMLDLAEWVAVGDWLTSPADPDGADEALVDAATRLLNRYRRRLKRRGRDLAELDDEARHIVRIQAKKLRYSAEFFAPLFTGDRRLQRRKAFLAALEALQNELGELNDLALAPAVLDRLRLADQPVAKALRQHMSSRGELLDRAAQAYATLIGSEPFWH